MTFDAQVKEIGQRYDKLTFKYTGTVAAVQLREHPAQAGESPLTDCGIADRRLLIGD